MRYIRNRQECVRNTSVMCKEILQNMTGICNISFMLLFLVFSFAHAEAGSLSLDNLVYLFIYLCFSS